MSNLQLSVDLSLSDKLSQALEKVIKPAQELSDEFDNLKKQLNNLSYLILIPRILINSKMRLKASLKKQND